jgi:hypothetical protein
MTRLEYANCCRCNRNTLVAILNGDAEISICAGCTREAAQTHALHGMLADAPEGSPGAPVSSN